MSDHEGPEGGGGRTATADVVHVIEFPYTRTTGPVIGPFLTGLRDGQIYGSRIAGTVYCPPLEWDRATGATAPWDPVPVGPGGEVVGLTWVQEPTRKHPFGEPFAFALIRLDGADTPILHAVKAAGPDAVVPGSRVRAQWRDERHGAITDIYFVPEADAVPQAIVAGEEPVAITEHHISLTIAEDLYPHRARYVQGLKDGKLIGQRSPVTGKVSIPGRGYDQMERVLMDESCDVVLADRGTVVGFTEITPVQYHGQLETEPYIRCSILLDGADQPLIGIDIRHIPVAEFRVGLRLQAVWQPPGERVVTDIDNRWGGVPDGVIERWDPTGEPDVDPSTLAGQAW
jgi:hypothetical protein